MSDADYHVLPEPPKCCGCCELRIFDVDQVWGDYYVTFQCLHSGRVVTTNAVCDAFIPMVNKDTK